MIIQALHFESRLRDDEWRNQTIASLFNMIHKNEHDIHVRRSVMQRLSKKKFYRTLRLL